MPVTRDPILLFRHAAQAGDWRLAELLGRWLRGHGAGSETGHRAYVTLVAQLQLAPVSADHNDR